MINIRGLHKSFNGTTVLNNIDLDIAVGEVVVVIGSSGTGKSTLLRCVNFLEQAERGVISVNDISVNAENVKQKELVNLRKHIAFVFQNYGLFANKTALQNITEGLIHVQGMSQQQADIIARRTLDSIGLSERADAWPSQLSGGQQQRVGIGRAMAQNADIIVMDEPTSALDPEITGEVMALIKQLADQKTTMLITTHEMAFARDIASRIIYMEGGEIVEQGTPEAVFDKPQDPRTQRFLSRL
ncbi:putative amino-acid import ATP-binding protein YxeO [Sinobacterium norvegicum]|uniref:Amino-acid import ATP-binding protein YxeO n=1 Tax=Sinobacterium norvegicum TaxID=1641715 RepID=A0ABN8EF82_9GAMM|nr:amino acid ABC transporter ATP-binding protein [Sinobacterium norvegicum]CAH0990293.1 putative amino-acid import ATP-binding protein YxeO [Sinobacterium norvegicum]